MTDTRLMQQAEHLEAACAKNLRQFALFTAMAFALVVCTWGAVLLGAVGGAVWAVLNLIDDPDNVAFWLILPLCAYGVWCVVVALRLRMPVPRGQRLTPQNAPRLFQLLREVNRKTYSSAPSDVLLVHDMEVVLFRQPRLGLLGWHRDTLLVGLPAMMTLDIKQFGAAMGRAFAQQGGVYGFSLQWLYRMRLTWHHLAQVHANDSISVWAGRPLVRFFFCLVFPYLNRRALVISRQQSFEADRMARRVAGPQSAMESLVRLVIQRRYLSEAFWPEVFDRASHSPTPNVLPFRAMRQRLRTTKAHPKLQDWLSEELARVAKPTDADASLQDRLMQAKASARWSKPPKQMAADLLLRESLDPLISEMDGRWQLDAASRWGQLHRHYLAQYHLEQDLKIEGEKGALHPDDHMLWARAARTVQGEEAFEALLRLMLIDHADDVTARYELGMVLINKSEAAFALEGAQLLRTVALAQDSVHALPAAKRYAQWLSLHGPADDQVFWQDEVCRIEHHAELALQALHDFDIPHSYTCPDLSARTMKILLSGLQKEPQVLRAYLVNKRVEAFAGWRFALLFIETNPRVYSADLIDRLQVLWQGLNLPCALAVLSVADPAWTGPARQQQFQFIKQMPGSAIYKLQRRVNSGPVSTNYMPA